MKKLLLICTLMTVALLAQSQTLSIAGVIETTNNIALCNTTVALHDENGIELANTLTNGDGYYFFESLATNRTYEVKVFREDDFFNGVSTFDLVSLSNHILGVRNIDNPFLLLALDVNNSGSLTTFDLLLMRKVILKLEEGFPVESWKFFASDAEINEIIDLPIDRRIYENLTISVDDADFMGYKVGDANNSIVINCN